MHEMGQPLNHCGPYASGTPIGILGHSLLSELRGKIRLSIGMPDDDLFIFPWLWLPFSRFR